VEKSFLLLFEYSNSISGQHKLGVLNWLERKFRTTRTWCFVREQDDQARARPRVVHDIEEGFLGMIGEAG